MAEKRASYLILGLCATGIILLGLVLSMARIRELHAEGKCGQAHTFEGMKGRSFLPDNLALEKATESLALQGFDTNKWVAMRYSQTRAPDGVPDRFLCRNHVDERRGVVTFTNRTGLLREVYVGLSNDLVICVVKQSRAPFR